MLKALLPKEEKYFDDFREMISHIQQMAKYTEQLFADELIDKNHYLNINGETAEATGGSEWAKYMHHKYQRRIFFPDVWTKEELDKWGQNI